MRRLALVLLLLAAAAVSGGCLSSYPMVLPGDDTFCARIRELSLKDGGNGFPDRSCRDIYSYRQPLNLPPETAPRPYPVTCYTLTWGITCY